MQISGVLRAYKKFFLSPVCSQSYFNCWPGWTIGIIKWFNLWNSPNINLEIWNSVSRSNRWNTKFKGRHMFAFQSGAFFQHSISFWLYFAISVYHRFEILCEKNERLILWRETNKKDSPWLKDSPYSVDERASWNESINLFWLPFRNSPKWPYAIWSFSAVFIKHLLATLLWTNVMIEICIIQSTRLDHVYYALDGANFTCINDAP